MGKQVKGREWLSHMMTGLEWSPMVIGLCVRGFLAMWHGFGVPWGLGHSIASVNETQHSRCHLFRLQEAKQSDRPPHGLPCVQYASLRS